jgi:hypothetical protein
VYQVHDWAEVHRLFERERRSKSAIAKRLGMSRPTVIRLLGLDADPEVAATVILEQLRRAGYAGGITILKEQVAAVRPAFLTARSYQRTPIWALLRWL